MTLQTALVNTSSNTPITSTGKQYETANKYSNRQLGNVTVNTLVDKAFEK